MFRKKSTAKRDVFEDPDKLKARIMAMMRRDAKKSPMFGACKERAFKGKTVYACELCDQHYYTGVSEKNYLKLKLEYPNLIMAKESKALDVDHILPVIPLDSSTKETDLTTIAKRTYCSEDNLQYICKAPCHKEKTKLEAAERKMHRDRKKKEKK